MPDNYIAMDERVISDRTWNGSQSWYRERIVEQGRVRLRYTVRCDAYVFQSYAEVKIWKGEWISVYRIAGEQMRTDVSYVDRAVKPQEFDADIAELRRVAIAILAHELRSNCNDTST
jgi:hypothetical protein